MSSDYDRAGQNDPTTPMVESPRPRQTEEMPLPGPTGPATVDLSAYAGQAVRVGFAWTVPEYFTGPAGFQIDSVYITGD